MGDYAVSQWGEGDLPKGQPKATWYDKYGRSRVLPTDPYSFDHYRSQGLRLEPPESPVPLVEDNSIGEGSANATRQIITGEPPEQPDIQILLDRIAALEAVRKRGPDKKKRKRRRKRTPS